MTQRIELRAIGRVVRGYGSQAEAPRQGRLADRELEIEVAADKSAGLDGLQPGQWLWVLLWFDRADRTRLKVHPRGDRSRPLSGVFNTRAPHRPNPIALDLGQLVAIKGNRLVLKGLDAVDGTPVLDLKPYVAHIDTP
ncbi:MAG: tRNA (N6-threonylcarbamoyladenosine(37)-N6)-methyltransferase TrmO [Deltaproteobacteria bacterium]|nr:tRNA (N6-threonylcarbamoyladenosine(37)-N6)-methyltransferase TrmO [Deltaproteobacteria bacterium]